MGRFYGKVGYGLTQEEVVDGVGTGVWTTTMLEKYYRGDILKLSSTWSEGTDLNDDLTIGNKISIVGEPFAYQNFSHMKYVELMGVKWKIRSVEVQRPRLILNLGGEYNE